MFQFLSCNLFLYLGLIWVLYKIIVLLSRFMVPPFNLLKRYQGGWAVVTGATDGIGLGFCQQLAKLGFNVCVVSRNKQKIDQTCTKLRQINKNIQTKAVVADFQNSFQPNFFQNLFAQIQELDIAVLVNNVGYFNFIQPYSQISDQNIKKQLTINIMPISAITRLVIPKMLNRNKRCGIISLSSSSILMRLRNSSNYCSTKLFDDILSRSLQFEYGQKIDFLSVRPGLVTSNMTKQTTSPIHCNKNQCASGSLRALGRYSHYAGSRFHELSEIILLLLPQYARDFFVGGIFWSIMQKIYSKIQGKKQK